MTVTAQDTPHPQVGDMQREAIVSLDLAGCNVMFVQMQLNEFEREAPISHRIETWPQAVRAAMEKYVAEWQERHAGRVVKGITMGVQSGTCVLALHWRPAI